MGFGQQRTLDAPVTMSLERSGDATDEWVVRTFAALEELARPLDVWIYVYATERGWCLSEDPRDEPSETDRVCSRVDSAQIVALLHEAVDASAAVEWQIRAEYTIETEYERAGGKSHDDYEGPLEFSLDVAAASARLDVNVLYASWIEGAGRARVDALAERLAEIGWRRAELDGWSLSDTTRTATNGARVLADDTWLWFHRPHSTAFEAVERASNAIEVVHALSDLFRPRVLEIHTAFVGDEAREKDRPNGYLWAVEEGQGEATAPGSAVRRTFVPTLDRESMRALAKQALADQRPGGLFGWAKARRPITWTCFEARDARVRLPAATRSDAFRLIGKDGDEHVLPIEHRDGQSWLCRREDDGMFAEPMAVAFDADGLGLTIRVGWSLWAHPGTPGWTELQRAAAQLERLGWRRGRKPE